MSSSNYIPKRDDYREWKDDWEKVSEWNDGTHDITHGNGSKVWSNGREGDKPSVIHPKYLEWMKKQDSQLVPYRKNDKPTRITIDGIREWKNTNNRTHRDHDRPALIESDGFKRWIINGGSYYYPEKSIITAIQENPEFAERYRKQIPNKSLTYDIQRELIKHNPALIRTISKRIMAPDLKEEWQSLFDLDDIGL